MTSSSAPAKQGPTMAAICNLTGRFRVQLRSRSCVKTLSPSRCQVPVAFATGTVQNPVFHDHQPALCSPYSCYSYRPGMSTSIQALSSSHAGTVKRVSSGDTERYVATNVRYGSTKTAWQYLQRILPGLWQRVFESI